MREQIFLDMLTEDSVSIRRQRFTSVDGVDYPIGDPWRRAFVNSSAGREQLEADVPEPFLSVIRLMWGDSPVLVDEH